MLEKNETTRPRSRSGAMVCITVLMPTLAPEMPKPNAARAGRAIAMFAVSGNTTSASAASTTQKIARLRPPRTEVRVASIRRQRGRDPTPEEIESIVANVGEYFERTSGPYHLTSELRDDGLIDMLDTRNALGMALSASMNAPVVRAPGGILRI